MEIILNPSVEPDLSFLALKKCLLEADNPQDVHIEPSQVFNIDEDSYLKPPSSLRDEFSVKAIKEMSPEVRVLLGESVQAIQNEFTPHPEELAKLHKALRFLETKPYGQKLFRDIILHEARTSRVTLTGNTNNPFVQKGYMPIDDTITIDVKDMATPSRRDIMHHFDNYGLLIMHEGDHAVTTKGVSFGQTEEEIALDRSCYEQSAVERENIYRADLGLKLRDEYVDMSDLECQKAESIKGKYAPNEIETWKREGIPEEVTTSLTVLFTKAHGLNKLCNGILESALSTVVSESVDSTLGRLGLQ